MTKVDFQSKYKGQDLKDVPSYYLLTVIERFDRISQRQRRMVTQELFRRYEDHWTPPSPEIKPNIELETKLDDTLRFLEGKYAGSKVKYRVIMEIKQMLAI